MAVKQDTDHAASSDEGAMQQFLTYQLGEELFGIEILRVKEIIEYNRITRVPLVPDYIAGVINLRGNVVPVVDLKHLFSGENAAISRRTCIIVVETGDDEEHMETGLLVDSVNEVVDISKSDIEPPPSFGTGIRTDFILGMGKGKERIIILLDARLLLSFEELEELSRIDFRALLDSGTEKQEH